MAFAGAVGDAVRAFLTGATARYGVQPDPALSLGGYAGRVPVVSRGFSRDLALAGIRIERVSGALSTGSVSLGATESGALKFTGPGGAGAAVALAAGDTRLIPGAAVDEWAVVTRLSANPLGGAETITVSDVHGGGGGFRDVVNAERAAGVSLYREVRLRNVSDTAVSGLKMWVGELGTQKTSNAAQLGASGPGTIGSTGKFSDWPRSGWVRIETSGGSLREIAYYANRTETALSVTARGQLGTSAAAGAASDIVRAVPGIRFASETPASFQTQTVADEFTAPSGVTWRTNATAGGSADFGSLAAGAELGVWMGLSIPAGAVAAPVLEVALRYQWAAAGVTYSNAVRGVFRVENTAAAGYELYLAEGTDAFDFEAAPVATFAALPYDYEGPLTEGVSRFVLRYRNRWGLLGQNVFDEGAYSLEVDGAGEEVQAPPSAPIDVFAQMDPAGGGLLVSAVYLADLDGADRGDLWRLWVSTDGVDPDPDAGPADAEFSMAGLRFEVLDEAIDLGAVLDGSPIRVIARVARAADDRESANSNMGTATWVAAPAPRTVGQTFLGRKRSVRRTYPGGAPGSGDDYVVDAGLNIRLEPRAGATWFYAGAVLIWRLDYDSGFGGGTWYLPSDWITNEMDAVGVGGSADAIEVVEWDPGVTELLGVNVDGVRVMEIDLVGKEVRVAGFDQVTHFAGAAGPAAVWPRWGETCFQVWDPTRGDWVSAMRIGPDGVLGRRVAIDQTLDQAGIEAV